MELSDFLASALVEATDPFKVMLARANATVEQDKQHKSEAVQIERKRKALAAGQLSKEDQAATRRAIQAWEAVHVWQTIGQTAVFIRHACACRECHTVFSHWMLEQVHREVPTRKRQTRASAEVMRETRGTLKNLEPKIGFQENSVEMCPVCAGRHGVNLSNPPVFEVLNDGR